MISVSCIFRPSRRVKETNKAGTFYITLSEISTRPDGSSAWQRSYVNTGLSSADGVMTDSVRQELKKLIRLIYCIIESLDAADRPYSRPDVVERLKLAVQYDDPSMHEIIKRAQTDFPLRRGLVSLGNEFKRDFQLIYSPRASREEDRTLTGFLIHKSLQFKNEGNLSTSRAYYYTSNSIEKFCEGNPFPLAQINKDFLIHYSNWLKETGVTESTQSFYLRNLRSALKYAETEKEIRLQSDLFEELNTKIYKSTKKKLNSQTYQELIRKVADAKFSDDKEAELVRDMFIFGFYCHGMELSDVINLKKENIKDHTLTFNRRQKGMIKEIPLDSATLNIIEKYNDSTKIYLFPLMEEYQGLLYYSISERVRKRMKKIGKKVGYPTLSFSTNIGIFSQ